MELLFRLRTDSTRFLRFAALPAANVPLGLGNPLWRSALTSAYWPSHPTDEPGTIKIRAKRSDCGHLVYREGQNDETNIGPRHPHYHGANSAKAR